MPLAQYDFHLDAWADWQKTVGIRDSQTGDLVPISAAVMEIRNTNFVLVLRLDAVNGRCMILNGNTISLYISAADSLAYFAQGNYPGAVQAVGYWGIGRAYQYDLFCTYSNGGQDRIMRGFFQVDPNISRPPIPIAMPVLDSLTIGQRGSYVDE